MKLNLKKLTDKADNSVFDEIIAKCEAKMASPFKKEDPKADPKDAGGLLEGSDAEEATETPEVEVKEDNKLDLSPEDLQKLLEMYSEMKGK